MSAAIINYCTVFYVLACVYGECLYNMYKDNTGTKTSITMVASTIEINIRVNKSCKLPHYIIELNVKMCW